MSNTPAVRDEAYGTSLTEDDLPTLRKLARMYRCWEREGSPKSAGQREAHLWNFHTQTTAKTMEAFVNELEDQRARLDNQSRRR